MASMIQNPEEIEFDVPVELENIKEDLKRIIALLEKLDDKNVFETNWKEDMLEIKKIVKKNSRQRFDTPKPR